MGVTIAFALGAFLIVAGAALVSLPLALIIAGLLVLIYAFVFLLEIGAP